MRRRRERAPTPDSLMADIHNLAQGVRTQRESRSSFDMQADALLDCAVQMLKDKGMPENQILKIFGDIDPSNQLDWYKHFFKK